MPRVVGFQELCQQPNGAIFSEYDSGTIKGLYRRGEPLETNKELLEYYGGVYSDFLYHDLIPWPDDSTMSLDPRDHKFCDINDGARWGKFKPDELFVLYDEEDIKKLVGLLTGSTKVEGEPS